jgi:hypothetical protein
MQIIQLSCVVEVDVNNKNDNLGGISYCMVNLTNVINHLDINGEIIALKELLCILCMQ